MPRQAQAVVEFQVLGPVEGLVEATDGRERLAPEHPQEDGLRGTGGGVGQMEAPATETDAGVVGRGDGLLQRG